MHRVTQVEALPDYRLRVTFNDGSEGIVSLADRLFGPMFEPLKDSSFFAQASVDEFGAVCWPNQADLAPDALYRRVKQAA
ncbi:DUF2442 domain-containing protein [Salinicola halophyticus]|uniref:DUF2442 domain-containing protein n=1 Tax=Salinicola halophyticus TaxID=1808881 RepID=UPI003F4682BC